MCFGKAFRHGFTRINADKSFSNSKTKLNAESAEFLSHDTTAHHGLTGKKRENESILKGCFPFLYFSAFSAISAVKIVLSALIRVNPRR